MKPPLPLLSIALVSIPLAAGTLNVSSYSMLNGGSGGFNYRDSIYTPCPQPANACDTTGAALSGGTGKLTDGYASLVSWNSGNTEPPGIEPFVGWNPLQGLANPVVTFYFASAVDISNVALHLDNLPSTGIALPDSVTVAGVSSPVAADSTGGPRSVNVGTNLTGVTSVSVQLFHGSNSLWLMLDEVTFTGDVTQTSIPEPGALGLLTAACTVALFRRHWMFH